MPHIDEGNLTIWLDEAGALPAGERRSIEAHLSECTECRERLAAMRELREDAQAILRLAAPPEHVKPRFEQILSRATSTPPRPSGTQRHDGGAKEPSSYPGAPISRLVRWAWAASLVVAAGAGWMGRELLQEARDRSGALDGVGEARTETVVAGKGETPAVAAEKGRGDPALLQDAVSLMPSERAKEAEAVGAMISLAQPGCYARVTESSANTWIPLWIRLRDQPTDPGTEPGAMRGELEAQDGLRGEMVWSFQAPDTIRVEWHTSKGPALLLLRRFEEGLRGAGWVGEEAEEAWPPEAKPGTSVEFRATACREDSESDVDAPGSAAPPGK